MPTNFRATIHLAAPFPLAKRPETGTHNSHPRPPRVSLASKTFFDSLAPKMAAPWVHVKPWVSYKFVTCVFTVLGLCDNGMWVIVVQTDKVKGNPGIDPLVATSRSSCTLVGWFAVFSHASKFPELFMNSSTVC